MKRILVHFS